MMRDRPQKEAALHYVIAKHWFPQLELIVQEPHSATRRSYNITDIDVYATVPDEFVGYRNALFDCKSSSRQSAISRALWLKGMMEYFDGERGTCILSDNIQVELDHHEAAAELNVSIMTLRDFRLFARVTDGQLRPGESQLADIGKWEQYFTIPKRYSSLQPAIDFSSLKYWLFRTPGDACRNTLVLLRQLRGELDPAKREHLVIFGDALALFIHALAQVTHRLFQAYLQPSSRQNLDEILLNYIYGGREAYSLLNRFRSSISREEKDLELPEWSQFAQLCRSFLDSPVQALYAPLLAREIAWSFFGDSGSLAFASSLVQEKPQIAKFCIQSASYLVKAAKLPPDFAQPYQEAFLAIQGHLSRTSSASQVALPLEDDG